MARQAVPAAGDVPDQGLGPVLGHSDTACLRVHAVRERVVDGAEVAGEWQRRLALAAREARRVPPPPARTRASVSRSSDVHRQHLCQSRVEGGGATPPPLRAQKVPRGCTLPLTAP
jgi:hypothetical protein